MPAEATKVLMVNTWHHRRGGDATYTQGLTRLLEAAGHTVVPFSMRHPDNVPSSWETRFVPWVDPALSTSMLDRVRLLRNVIWSPTTRRHAAALIRDIQPDVAHLQHVHRHLSPSVLDALDDAGVPAVWTVHDYELICPSGHLFTEGKPCERCRGGQYHQAVLHRCKWNGLLPSAAVAIEKWVHQHKGVWERIHRFLCPSQFLADTLVRFGVPQDRVQHVPNTLEIPPHQRTRRKGSGWVYAGRLAEEKGVKTALEVAQQLPQHPFTVCGVGPQLDELRAAFPQPNIHFVGHLPHDQLEEVLRSARGVVVPSIWYENYPYAVLEAQALGRAVVASDIGGIPEQITHGTDGLLVPPGDVTALLEAMTRVLEDPILAQRLGRAGRKRVVANLRPETHLDRVLSVYESATGKRLRDHS